MGKNGDARIAITFEIEMGYLPTVRDRKNNTRGRTIKEMVRIGVRVESRRNPLVNLERIMEIFFEVV